ncbi:cation transporter, partial [Klebsiella quasipneumoniae]
STYSWLGSGFVCASCARMVDSAFRQVRGVSEVQVVFATENLLVIAVGDVRAQFEQAVREAGDTLRDAVAPESEKSQGSRLRDNLPLL